MATRDQLTIGLSLSLSGEYAAMGRQAEAALRLFVADQNSAGGIDIDGRHFALALEGRDDRSNAETCTEIYRSLCLERRADLILGPYSSRLMRAAAPIVESAGIVLVNHGGADDELHSHHRMIVSVLSPAGDYLLGFARLLGTLRLSRKRVAILAAPTPFARSVAAGFVNACDSRPAHQRRIRVAISDFASRGRLDDSTLEQLARSRINVIVAAGSFTHDVAVMRAIINSDLNVPVLACVAAGVSGFGAEMGERADGIIGPSQWEEHNAIQPLIGPAPAEFGRRMRAAYQGIECDYPAAQAYAAGLLAVEALRRAGTLDQQRLRQVFGDLRTTTLYGDFAIDRSTGRQVGHQVLLVQWHRGRKVLINPESHAEVAPFALHPRPRRLATILRALRARTGSDE